MHEAGCEDPYIGVESGDDEILRRVNEGYDAATAREQLEKHDAARGQRRRTDHSQFCDVSCFLRLRW